MSGHSQRLRRILRKYRLDHRLDQRQLAASEHERATLLSHKRKLSETRTALQPREGGWTGRDLARSGEWIERLGRSTEMLAAPLAQSQIASEQCRAAERRSARREERLEEAVKRSDETAIRKAEQDLAPYHSERNPRRGDKS